MKENFWRVSFGPKFIWQPDDETRHAFLTYKGNHMGSGSQFVMEAAAHRLNEIELTPPGFSK